MGQFEFVAWLAKWLLQQKEFEFDWDQWNSTKSLQKHKIETDSAEEVFNNKEFLVPLGIQVAPVTNEPRFGALGMDYSGKMLSVCFTIREGKIRVISIRPMSRLERKNYASLREE
ncbi:MAG: BrnT family toxin [Bacteriovoracia bacterium]